MKKLVAVLALVAALCSPVAMASQKTDARAVAKAAAEAQRVAAKEARQESKAEAKEARQAAHGSPAADAAEAPMATSGVTLTGATLSGHGLEPGHVYYASFVFTPIGGGGCCSLGWTALTVKPDGTIRFPNSLTDVDPAGVPGSLHAWLRDGEAFSSPVATGPDGTPLETTTTIGA